MLAAARSALTVVVPRYYTSVLPDRALCLPTFSHFLMSIKLLSFSLSLSLLSTHVLFQSVVINS
jgi:hypothetical protein